MIAQSGRSYFGINATIVNGSHYSVNISTFANNILSFLDYSIIAFNPADITSNYSVFLDVMTFSIVGNSANYTQPIITADQYQFRNCITGAVDIIFNVTSVAMIGYYYSVTTANDNFLFWRTLNNRVRTCPANYTFYNTTGDLCQD